MKFIISGADKRDPDHTSHIELPTPELPDPCIWSFAVTNISSTNLMPIQKYLPQKDVNLMELNLLAYQLNGFSEKQCADYDALIHWRENVSVKNLINYAYDLGTGKYEIWHGVSNYTDLGRRFVKKAAPGLPHQIADNISYTNVGLAMESEGGKLTSFGFIANYCEQFYPTYNGDNLEQLLCPYLPYRPDDLHTVNFTVRCLSAPIPRMNTRTLSSSPPKFL